MFRSILTGLLSGVILFAFAVLPPMLPGSTTMSLAGSAQAQKQTTPKPNVSSLNTSRSDMPDVIKSGAKKPSKPLVATKPGTTKPGGGKAGIAVNDPGAPSKR